jgi:hypothetical protein
VTSAPTREALFLVRQGVDLDLAFQLDDITRAAWCIIYSEMDGAKFSFATMAFKSED